LYEEEEEQEEDDDVNSYWRIVRKLGYSKLKKKALNHSLRKTRCRRGCGTVVRQITERKKE
jgi:hypothetical protein